MAKAVDQWLSETAAPIGHSMTTSAAGDDPLKCIQQEMETLRISRHVNRRLDTVPIHYDVIRLKYVCNLYTDAGGSTDMDSFYRSRSDE